MSDVEADIVDGTAAKPELGGVALDNGSIWRLRPKADDGLDAAACGGGLCGENIQNQLVAFP